MFFTALFNYEEEDEEETTTDRTTELLNSALFYVLIPIAIFEVFMNAAVATADMMTDKD